MYSQRKSRRAFLKTCGITLVGTSLWVGIGCGGANRWRTRPNILFCISDDQSWEHASIYGDGIVETPHFDRIAQEGVLFHQAYTTAPSCAPSRAGILTGQDMWRLEEGGLLFGALPNKFPVFPRLLEESGYSIGYTGKGYAPANHQLEDCWNAPLGNSYNVIKHESPQHISNIDYAANFEQFLQEHNSENPFFFWYGAFEPHQRYDTGIGQRSGKEPERVRVPEFLPDVPVVRNDILDYYYEIEWQDAQLGRMIEILEQQGLLDETLIVATSDNGMPFPRAKTTLYDHGVRMPLAIRWGKEIPGGRVVDDFVSLTDLTPTFLESANVDIPKEVTGKSLLPILFTNQSGRIDRKRNQIVTGIERHVWCRPDGAGYPRRAVRDDDWLYIRNYAPERWPAGNPDFVASHQGTYGDIDGCPTKKYMIEHRNDPELAEKFALAFEKLPAEELYNVNNDPYQIRNVADIPGNKAVLDDLRNRLDNYQRLTADPRIEGKSPWDHYPFYYGDYAKKSLPG